MAEQLTMAEGLAFGGVSGVIDGALLALILDKRMSGMRVVTIPALILALVAQGFIFNGITK